MLPKASLRPHRQHCSPLTTQKQELHTDMLLRVAAPAILDVRSQPAITYALAPSPASQYRPGPSHEVLGVSTAFSSWLGQALPSSTLCSSSPSALIATSDSTADVTLFRSPCDGDNTRKSGAVRCFKNKLGQSCSCAGASTGYSRKPFPVVCARQKRASSSYKNRVTLHAAT